MLEAKIFSVHREKTITMPTSYDIVANRALFNLTKRHEFIRDLRGHQPGDLKWSAMAADFHGWLVCDGRALSRTAYPTLFQAIGVTYGNNSSTDFLLPDCRGRAMGACGQGAGLTMRAMGATAGAETCILTASNMPAHSHTASCATSGDHTHSTNAVGGSLGLISANGNNTAIDVDGSAVEPNLYSAPVALDVNNAGSHAHTITVGNTGAGTSFGIVQPTMFVGNVFVYSGVQEPLADSVVVNGRDDTFYEF